MNEDNQHTVREIEISIKQAREFVALSDALDRLSKNRDFQKVILQSYFKDEAARLVEAKAAPNLEREEFQRAIIKAIDGIGSLQQFFNKVSHQGDMAKQSIHEGQQALDEMAEQGEVA